jgi:acetyltransferase-like isoleucine patch superfamily enzyme
VQIGEDVWIGQGCLIDTACPSSVRVGNGVTIGIRTTIVAHFQEVTGVTIGNEVYIGAGALILPGVTIGEGAVIAAGSVVANSVPPMTAVQGNPARPVAKCEIPLGRNTPRMDFVKHLKKL